MEVYHLYIKYLRKLIIKIYSVGSARRREITIRERANLGAQTFLYLRSVYTSSGAIGFVMFHIFFVVSSYPKYFRLYYNTV